MLRVVFLPHVTDNARVFSLLVSLGKSSSAALERLYQQTEALVNEISEEGGAGAFVNINDDFLL